MNKLLQIFGVIALTLVIAFGFVGCGTSDEDYYAKLLTAVNNVPQEDYTIISTTETYLSGNKNISKIIQVYNAKDNKYYSKDSYSHLNESGDVLSNDTDETWVLQNGSVFGEYKKKVTTTGENSMEEYTAKAVSEDHAKSYLNSGADVTMLDSTEFPATYEEFEDYIINELLGNVPEGVKPKFESKFSTKKKVHALSLEISTNAEAQGQIASTKVELIINFTDTEIRGVELNMEMTIDKEVVQSIYINGDIDYSCDASLLKEFSQTEFANTEIETNYSIWNDYVINNKATLVGYSIFNDDLLYQLNRNFAGAYTGVNFEYYYDKEYTLQVGSTDKVKSYEQNIYIKATPQEGYALVIIYGDNNSILCTNTGAVALNTADYQYTYNGEVIDGDVFNVEGNQTYYIEATNI